MGNRVEWYIIAALSLLPSTLAAHDYRVGDLVIAHPFALETPRSAMTGAGYLTMTNTGATDDRLLAIAADFPRVTLHATQVANDIAAMQALDGITIPAGATVALEPGGYHVMFMGLNGDPFEPGEEITATLTFEHAGDIPVIFKVEPRPDAAAHAH